MPFEILIDRSEAHPIVILKDTHTGTEAEIYCFGGLLNAFRVSFNETKHNIIDGYSGVVDALNNMTNGFKSARLSPFVCRLNKGAYTYAGQHYQISKHFLKDHAIHGLVYDNVYAIAHSEADSTGASVTLQSDYKGTDAGYPFPYTSTITWKLALNNEISVTTTIINKHDAPIPMAEGWHPYFTLGGSVDEWTLQFSAANQLEYDTDLLPTGKEIADTRFLNGLSLKGISLDNGFAWRDKKGPNTCHLRNESIALTIRPDEAYPILQVYTPPGRKSIAIENLSGAPDNFNNGIDLIELPSQQAKTFTTTYQVNIL
jgi:aldose 1-epimerase